jgi:UDP-N-acetyl-D-mannosaminuronate dehydrogenase
VNPYFLIEAGKYSGSKLRMVKLARKLNDQLLSHTIKLVVKSLRDAGRSIRRARIAVFGASYKANVKNLTYSPIHLLVDRLSKKGAEVRVYDPFFTSEELRRSDLPAARGVKGTLEGANLLLITVGHDEFKTLNLRSLTRLMNKPAVVIDCGNALDPIKVEEEKLVYYRLGRGAKK